MSEVEKLYKNAGVKKQYDYTVIKKNYNGKIGYTRGAVLEKIEQFKNKTLRIIKVCPFYPDFTAAKQIEIIKLISKQGQIIIENWEKDNRGFNVTFRANSNLRYITMDCITRKTVEEALAQIVNDLWQDLTEQEITEISEILKGRF